MSIAEGGDPLGTRQRLARAGTVRELCSTYIERHAKPHKRSWVRDQNRIERWVLPAWASLKAGAIRRADVQFLHQKVGRAAGPIEANRLVALLSVIFRLSGDWGFTESPNPARGVQKFREQSRDRWAKPAELPKLAQAIDEHPNVYIRAALWVLLLSGLRKSEVLSAKWTYVDWDRMELRIGETKSGRPHYAPLSARADSILQSLPRFEGNPHIFPGTRGGPLAIDRAWVSIRSKAGLVDVTIHDLRRSAASWLVQGGISLHLVGRILVTQTLLQRKFMRDSARTMSAWH